MFEMISKYWLEASVTLRDMRGFYGGNADTAEHGCILQTYVSHGNVMVQ
jgi:hypothetical protein